MPDLQNFSITPQVSININVPSYVIAGRITDSQTGTVLADFTGLNAIQFPSVLGTLTAQQRRDLLDLFVTQLIFAKAGL